MALISGKMRFLGNRPRDAGGKLKNQAFTNSSRSWQRPTLPCFWERSGWNVTLESAGSHGRLLDLQTGQVHICSNCRCVATIAGDRSVVTFGNADSGGDITAVQDQPKNVQQIQDPDEAVAGWYPGRRVCRHMRTRTLWWQQQRSARGAEERANTYRLLLQLSLPSWEMGLSRHVPNQTMAETAVLGKTS